MATQWHSDTGPRGAYIPLEPIVQRNSPSTSLLDDPKHLPPGWPTSPKRVRPLVRSIISDLLYDIVLLALSAAFLAFGLTVRHYDQAPVDQHPLATSTLLEATKLGASVFPILFACVVGRATHAILIWRLETGERIGILDLLAGSTSLTSTITSQLKLRILSLLGVALMVIWSLSPVGGQASIRVMTIGSQVYTTQTTIRYMILGSQDLDAYGSSERASPYAIANALFLSSLATPYATKLSSMDTWGNVKIPSIEYYENSSISGDEGWFTGLDSKVYTSLIGIPMLGITGPFKNYTMSLETSYLHLDCPVLSQGSFQPVDNTSTLGTADELWSATDYSTRMDPANESILANATDNRYITYNFREQAEAVQAGSVCSVTTTYVEVEVVCNITTATLCAPSRIRRSRRDNPPSAYTVLDGSWNAWIQFADGFVNSMAGHPGFPTPVQNYLLTPDNPLRPWTESPDESVPPLTTDTLAVRLGQLVNTYWTCFDHREVISGGIKDDSANSTASGTESHNVHVIESHTNWVIALFISSMVMIITGLVNPIVRICLTRAPDVMLNISSLATRNNEYMALPSSGTFMDASERAKLLKDVRVRFGNVEPTRGIGKLAMGSLEPSGPQPVAKIRKECLYE